MIRVQHIQQNTQKYYIFAPTLGTFQDFFRQVSTHPLSVYISMNLRFWDIEPFQLSSNLVVHWNTIMEYSFLGYYTSICQNKTKIIAYHQNCLREDERVFWETQMHLSSICLMKNTRSFIWLWSQFQPSGCISLERLGVFAYILHLSPFDPCHFLGNKHLSFIALMIWKYA